MTTSGREHMPSRVRWLIGLNAGLALALGAVTVAPRATAQQETARAPGNYTLVGGRDRQDAGSVVYVVDAANQEMVALHWDEASRSLKGLGYRDLREDAEQKGRR